MSNITTGHFENGKYIIVEPNMPPTPPVPVVVDPKTPGYVSPNHPQTVTPGRAFAKK